MVISIARTGHFKTSPETVLKTSQRRDKDRSQITRHFVKPMLRSEAQALELINQKLKESGCNPISRSTLYKCRDVYVATFPKSQWLKGNQLCYSESVILFLYFVARMHLIFNQHLQRPNWHATRIGVKGLIQQLNGQRFSEVYGNFSSVNSYFTKEQVA